MVKKTITKVCGLLAFFFLLSTYNVQAQEVKELDFNKVEKLRKGFKTHKFFRSIFKYATFYGAYSEQNSIQGEQTYSISQDNVLTETTIENPVDYSIIYGYRKLAHFSYEDKKQKGYDGTESPIGSKSNVGATKGLEYQFQYNRGRQQNQEFENKYAFVRYLQDYWFVKGEYNNNELIDLNYVSGEARFRMPLGKKKRLSLSTGVIYRKYQKAYGFSPITEYFEDNSWWDLPLSYYGYTDELYQMTNTSGQSMGFDWNWYDAEGNQVANSDSEFRNVIMGGLINNYNKEKLAEIEPMADMSIILGLDYYVYRKNFHAHIYANVLPYHKTIEGDKEYSYNEFLGKDDFIDYSVGGVLGFKLGKHIGIFSEIAMQRYWDREFKSLQIGINYQI
jgi:hypothetical protein